MSRTQRRLAKNRLKRARLNWYCQEPKPNWPSPSFLESLEADVSTLTAVSRVSWSTLQRLDKRLPSLRLALRFDNLVNHALACLDHAPQATVERARPLIQWLVKFDDPRVRKLEAANHAVAVEVREQIRLNQDAKREHEREAARIRKQRERLEKNFDKKA